MTDRARPAPQQVVRGVRGARVRIEQRISNYFGSDPPLVPPFSRRVSRRPAKRGSVLQTLRASESQAPLVGRKETLAQALRWLHEAPADAEAPDHRVLLIHGPAGSGKTRLAGEILQRAADEGWIAGFLSSAHAGSHHWSRLAHPEEPLAVAIDYAETRRADLRELFTETLGDGSVSAPLRVILVVREGKAGDETWYERLAGIYDLGARAEELLEEEAITEVSLEESLPVVDDRQALWRWAVKDAYEAPAYLALPLFQRPLFVLLDAHDASTGGRFATPGEPAPPTAERLIDGVLRHERTYWTLALRQARLDLDDRSVNEVAAAATLVGGIARPLFDQALTGLPWLDGDGGRAPRIADWWCSVYASADGSVRGVEPDMVGERLVVRAMGEPTSAQDTLGGVLPLRAVTSFVSAAPLVGRQRVLRVLTRMANDSQSLTRDEARAILSELLNRHLEDFLPATFTQPDALDDSSVGESLATTVASAVLACGEFDLVVPRARSVEGANPASGARDGAADEAALRIVLRQLERIAQREYDAGRFSQQQLAAILGWALRIDVRADRLEAGARRIAKVEALDPRPHRELAGMYLVFGRHQLFGRNFDAAEAAFQAALREIDALGEEDDIFRHVVQHDQGLAAADRGDAVAAVALLEQALAGKVAARGLSHHDTITTLLTLATERAVLDADGALSELADAADSLEATGTDPDEVRRIREAPARALYHAADRLQLAGKRDQARTLYERALRVNEEQPVQPAVFPYVVTHALADLALADGDADTAARLYADALAGKRRVRGPAHPDTVTTVLALARASSRSDVDDALDKLAAARAELAPDDLVERSRIDRLRIQLLARHDRREEARALDDELQHATLAHDIRSAILDVIADPTLPPPDGRVATIAMAELANRIFPAGDGRLAALACRLADLYETRVSQSLSAAFAETAVAPLVEAVNDAIVSGSSADAARALDVIQPSMPLLSSLAEAARERVRVELERALADPLIASIGTGGGCLALDRQLRRWIVEETLMQPTLLDRSGQMIGAVQHLAMARIEAEFDETSSLETHTRLVIDSILRERDAFAAAFEAHESATISPERTAQAVAITYEAAATALWRAAREARSGGAIGMAIELLRQGLQTVHGQRQRHSGIVVALYREIFSLFTREHAMYDGSEQGARDSARAGFIEARRLGMSANAIAVDFVVAIATDLAALDPETACAEMARTADVLELAGAERSVVARLRAWRVQPRPAAAEAD